MAHRRKPGPPPPPGPEPPAGVGCLGALISLLLTALVALLAVRGTGHLALPGDPAYLVCGTSKLAFAPGAGPFQFNPGEPGAGVASPLQAVLHACLSEALARASGKAFPSPRELEAASYLLAGLALYLTLALGMGACGLCTVRARLTGTHGVLLFLTVTFLHPGFVRGVFSGGETPLAALALVALAAEAAEGFPRPSRAAAWLAWLGACRPDWEPVALVAVWQLGRSPGRSGEEPVGLLRPLAAFIAATAACYGPFWAYARSWTPTAPGGLSGIPFLQDPHRLPQLLAGFEPGYWNLLPLAVLAAVVAGRERGGPGPIRLAAWVVLWVVLGALLGLRPPGSAAGLGCFVAPGLAVLVIAAACPRLPDPNADWVPGSDTGILPPAAPAPPRPPRPLLVALVGSFVLLSWGVAVVSLQAADRGFDEGPGAAARAVAAQVPAGGRIVTGTPGVVRVFTEAHVIDLAGVATRHRATLVEEFGVFDLAAFLEATGARWALLGDREVPAGLAARGKRLGAWPWGDGALVLVAIPEPPPVSIP